MPSPRALALALCMVLPAFSGCLAAHIGDLFTNPPPATPGTTTKGTSHAFDPSVTWHANDTWTWSGTDGSILTDTVVAVHSAKQVLNGQNVTFPIYQVRSHHQFPGGLPDQWITHYYNFQLGVINSSEGAQSFSYTSGGVAWEDVPLTSVTERGTFNFSVVERIQNVTQTLARSITIVDEKPGLASAFDGSQYGVYNMHYTVLTQSPTGVVVAHSGDRAFNATIVKNDVVFATDLVVYRLAAYSVSGQSSGSSVAPQNSLNEYWLAGWQWVYTSPYSGAYLSRQILPCTFDLFGTNCTRPSYSSCALPGCDALFAVWHGTNDYIVQDTMSFGTGHPYMRIELVDADTLRVTAVQLFSTTNAGRFAAAEAFSPGSLPVSPVQATYSFTGIGFDQEGHQLNDNAAATMTVGPLLPYATPAGTYAAERTDWNISWTPTPGSTGSKFTDSGTRVYSPEIRNDVSLVEGFGASGVAWKLSAVSLSTVTPPLRDL
ncbi:MAG: hypothetical protein ACYDDF_04975 [Thermoplasmatota archaeon]